MNRAGVRGLIRELMGHQTAMTDQGQWVMSSCPLAPWRHGSGRDVHPSFGVHVNDGGQSGFNCFACKAKGSSLVDLLDMLYQYTGDEYYNEFADELDGIETYGGNLPEYDQIIAWVQDNLVLGDPQDPAVLDIYEPAHDHPYLQQRGITNETVEYLDLKVDPNNKGVERILFPVFDPDGHLHGFTGRATRSNVLPKIRDYPGLHKELLLLGSHFLEDSHCVMLVEGIFDYARMFQYGYYAVACMHSGLTQAQANILIDQLKPVYLFYDSDRAGKQGEQLATQLLAPHLPVLKVRYPVGRQDPDECTEDEIAYMVQQAEIV